ncbi:hypothetical protein CUZ87_1408 [Enterococcus xinjiangensis]|nr:hypothetical protein [Enterococcus lactis]
MTSLLLHSFFMPSTNTNNKMVFFINIRNFFDIKKYDC